MARVKILLDEGESIVQAESDLLKALTAQTNGDTHEEEFTDPATQDVNQTMVKLHEEMMYGMMQEIFKVLDEDYR